MYQAAQQARIRANLHSIDATKPAANGGELPGLAELIAKQLQPDVVTIDQDGFYPRQFLQDLGELGGYAGVVAPAFGGSGLGLTHSVQVMAKVSQTCLSTGFAIWCQTACLRYLQLSDNENLKIRFLPALVDGRLLGGTGLSNTLKFKCGIERALLKARRVAGGYAINGNLPWVSNLGPGHVFVTGCPVEDDGRLLFFLVETQRNGFRLVEGAHFAAMEGTGTQACQFRDYFVGDDYVLAQPEKSENYLAKIKPGMILAQMGMGLGLIRACIDLIESANKSSGLTNQYLDDQAEELADELAIAERETYRLTRLLDNDTTADVLADVLKVRLAGSELSLRASQSALLHQGAKGFLTHSAAQRKVREAYFVAIVTPAIKQLRRELANLKSAEVCALPLS
ncbi:acyl-CoA dehydrogenase family protein [Methylomonas methanica]|uniref:acyl-CoA dehydrogenase family protein n=1 Tax=Methylomonas methanica TaxID=421 RepID=UPI0007C96595|nr:acyl-CoA dehydrogenase family protein [Methylomonas methanica]